MRGSSLQHPVVLEDDEHDIHTQGSAFLPIEIDNDEEDEFDSELEELFQRTKHVKLPDDADDDDDTPVFIRETGPKLRRNTLAYNPNCITNEAGVELGVGQSWELIDGTFFHIERFVRVRGSTEIHAEGDLFRRSRHANRMLSKQRNELCMFVTINHLGSVIPSTAPISTFVIRREIVQTNAAFPSHTHRQMLPLEIVASKDPSVKKFVEETARLTCRWKKYERLDETGRQVVEEGMVCLREEEADIGKSVSDVKRWQHFHNTFTPGSPLGSKRGSVSDDEGESDEDEDVVMVDSYQKRAGKNGIQEMVAKVRNRKKSSAKVQSLFSASSTSLHQQHHSSPSAPCTFGDICAGAGGVSCGARKAGLDIRYQLDNNSDVCKTLKMNFTSEVLERDVFDFIELAKRNPRRYRVTILHLSLPCQYFSACHTVPGKNDDKNIYTNLCVEEMLRAVRPRIVTFEQAPGILWRDGGVYFHTLIRALTSNGYSVRWRKLNLAEYGNYQARKRLILIAAAPGEVVPDFPEPTHSAVPRTGTKRFTWIKDALSIAKSFGCCFANMRLSSPKNGTPYCPKKPLERCITTDGGLSDLHPNGKRSFTLQELALLQAFPPEHRFHGGLTSVRRQIGNAVPSCFAETLFGKIIESLDRSDRIAEAAKGNKEIGILED